MSSPAVPYRLLAAVETLLGAGGSLENVLDPLESGALCWVRAEGALYSFEKWSTEAVSPPGVIATARGSSFPGRWLRYVAASSTAPFSNAFWVDKGAAPGGNGSGAAPFDTVAAAVAVCPTGGTILVLAGDYTSEAPVPVGSKTLTFMGFGGQAALAKVLLPTIQYASGGTPQRLAFRNVSATVERTGASVTQIYLDYCPFIELTGAGSTSEIVVNGDLTCAVQGEGGLLQMKGGYVGPYTANGGAAISLYFVGIYGNLSTAGLIAFADACAWTTPALAITASTIFWDLSTAYQAGVLSITTSSTPVVQEAHNASDTFPAVVLAVGTSDVPIDVSSSLLAGIAVGDAVVATWGAPGPAGFGNAAIGGCLVTAPNQVTVRFVGVTGGGNSAIILTWLQSP